MRIIVVSLTMNVWVCLRLAFICNEYVMKSSSGSLAATARQGGAMHLDRKAD
jgi:hypothetical protein